MLKKISSKIKLLIPTLILTIILFFLGIMVIKSNYTKMQNLDHLYSKIILSRYIASTLDTLQKERGLSSGFIEDKGYKFTQDLLKQRKITDKQINQLLQEKFISTQFKDIILSLNNIRKQIDNKHISAKHLIQYYSTINDILLKNIVKILKKSHNPTITQKILVYIHFLYLKEYGGIERAQGAIILSHLTINQNDLIKFINLISLQKQHEKMLMHYITKEDKAFYTQQIKNISFTQVKKIEHRIIYNDMNKLNVDPKQWFIIITNKLDIIEKVGQYIENSMKIKVYNKLITTKQLYYFVLFLTIISLGLFILMIIAVYRIANEEQRLRMISQKYIISSITDPKGRIIEASDAFCEISGYTKEELIGKPHNIVRHPDMPSEAFKNMWNTIKSKKAWKGKVKNLKKDGGFYWVWAHIEPIYDIKGDIYAYISIRLDITENELLIQKVKEEEDKNKTTKEIMYQQNRLAQMGEMISMIAHQWRQPLTAIAATSGSLILKSKLKKLDSETTMKLAKNIQELSRYLSDTIEDFRGFFKENKTKSLTDFNQIIKDVLTIVSSSLQNNNIEVIIDIVSYKKISVYESEIKQVILNIIKNAQDALRENNVKNPQIVIEINDNILNIYDNAGGIPNDIIDKIFDPYFTTKRQKDGTGLGLYMSKTIVQEHCNGSLSVSNVQKTQIQHREIDGAKFTIVLT